MTSRISARRPARKALADESGEALVGFGLVLPMLVLISLGTLEFTLSVFDYHRAGEATRRGARAAAIADAMVTQNALSSAGSIVCASTAAGVNCGGAAAVSPEGFSAVLADMKAILPSIAASNVEVVYTNTGIGDMTTPGGLIPLVTVRLKNLRHDYLMVSGIPGMGNGFTYQPMGTSRMGGGMGHGSGSGGSGCG